MKKSLNIFIPLVFVVSVSLVGWLSCKPTAEWKNSKARKTDSISLISSNVSGTGRTIEIEMIKGKAFNHPTFALWIEDTNGNYIQTLFITRAIGQGIFTHGDNSGGTWKPGEVRRPAALPYWIHKRGIITDDGSLLPTPRQKVPDAYSGATPEGSFRLTTKSDNPLKGKIKVVMEINQPWDWNEYWNNSRYPDDFDYKTSCQPALVYSTVLDLDSPGKRVALKPVGHSHYSGKTGELFTDISTITTALHIAEQVNATIK